MIFKRSLTKKALAFFLLTPKIVIKRLNKFKVFFFARAYTRRACGLIIKSLLFNYLPREIKNNNNSKAFLNTKSHDYN